MQDQQHNQAAAQQNAQEDNAATTTATHRRTDDKYALSFFHGKSSEDAIEYAAYLQRYAAYKHLTDDKILELLPVLLCDAASDFYDTLGDEQKSSWPNFKAAFLKRFGRSTVQHWKDTNALWTQVQGNDKSADDFVSRLTRLAKHLPSLDPSTLQCAVIRGLKPHIRQNIHDGVASGSPQKWRHRRPRQTSPPSWTSCAPATPNTRRLFNNPQLFWTSCRCNDDLSRRHYGHRH